MYLYVINAYFKQEKILFSDEKCSICLFFAKYIDCWNCLRELALYFFEKKKLNTVYGCKY